MRALALLLLFAAMPALAQPAGVPSQSLIQCSPRVPPDADRVPGSGWMPMAGVAEHLNSSAPALSLEAVRQASKAVPTVTFRVTRPVTIKSADEWHAAFFEAVLYDAARRPGEIRERDLIRGRVLPPSPADEVTEVTALFPTIESGWWPRTFELVLFVCVDPGYTAGARVENGREMRAYARETLFFSSLRLSALAGVMAVVLVYLALALVAARLHRRQHAEAARREGEAVPPLWLYVLRPTVIAQDAFGHCSLSRFQVLLFTLTVTGVYAYVHARTGQLPELSESVLWLLGITLTGSTLARIAEQPTIDTPNRLWLFATGVLDPAPRIPRWADMVANDGEIDVTRVQALVFSAFAAVALVINGTGDLENFRIPEQLNYLIGISQGVYVAGRALPQDTARRLNGELRQIREAEARLLAAPGDAAARSAFETARAGLAPALLDVFDERFRAGRLAALEPGARVPA